MAKKLTEAKSTPFDVLDNAINQLRQAAKDRSIDRTFLRLVNILYVEGFEDVPSETPKPDNNQQPTVDQINRTAAVAGAVVAVGAVGRVAAEVSVEKEIGSCVISLICKVTL